MEKIKLDKPILEAVRIAIAEAIKKELQLSDDFDLDKIEGIEVSAWIDIFYNRLVEEKP